MGQDGKVYFSPKAICEGLGIDWPSQRTKIMADAVLSSTVVEITMVAQDGKQRLMTMLPKEMAPGWLFTIKKVAPEVQAKLNRFRLECFVAYAQANRENSPVWVANCGNSHIYETKRGHSSGTFVDRRLAIAYAQWINRDTTCGGSSATRSAAYSR